jgi:hypothetical protein
VHIPAINILHVKRKRGEAYIKAFFAKINVDAIIA